MCTHSAFYIFIQVGDCIEKFSPGALQSVGRRDGSNLFIGVVHYRTGNKRKLNIAISALELLKNTYFC